MKKKLYNLKPFAFFILFALQFYATKAQTCEWRLVNALYNPVDPDGGGPANGSVTFSLQLHTVSGSIPNITGISTGWSWQSANAMLPTGVPCGTISIPQPSNITMGTIFATAGFTYNNVDECAGTGVNFTAGGQSFNRRASGSIDGGNITLTTAWIDVFTVTLWTLNPTAPQGGYAVINSGIGATNVPAGIVLSSYTVSDIPGTEFPVNSLTYTIPLPLGNIVTPVLFSSYDVKCSSRGTNISWSTASESNSKYFDIEKSFAGSSQWKSIGQVQAAGNSVQQKNYQFIDLEAGNALYRIKQVDSDGRNISTATRPVSCASVATQNDILIYPTPAKDNVTLVLKMDRPIKTTLKIIDAMGKTVQTAGVSFVAGTNNITLDTHTLASGQYILVSADPAVYINQRFIIAR